MKPQDKNNLPLFFEELKLKEEAILSLQELIAQFKQQIPVNFVYLEIKKKNYQCSTTGWKEPVCERYGFTWQNQWIQLDIPHSLLEKLGLKVKKDLPTNFYLAPHLLKKDQETTQGGITIQEGEIILLDPHKITIKDQEIQTDLNCDKIKGLEETVVKQVKQIQAKDIEIIDLKKKKNELEKSFSDNREEWKKTKNQLEQWLELSMKYYSADYHYLLLKDISNEFNLNFIFSYGNPWFKISNSPVLTKLKLPDNLRGIIIEKCPNLEELKLPAGLTNFEISGAAGLKKLEFPASSRSINIRLDEGWEFFGGILDISRCLEKYFSLRFGWVYLNGSGKTIIKCKIIFHKSQREKEGLCNYISYWDEERKGRQGSSFSSSLSFLISKGVITNYEERN